MLLNVPIARQVYSYSTGSWPRHLPSELPGLRKIDGAQDSGQAGATLCRIGRVRSDGSFWIQPLILHEPPRLCSWNRSDTTFPSPSWQRKAIERVVKCVAGRTALVVVLDARKVPWTVVVTVDAGHKNSFMVPDSLFFEGYALSKNRDNRAYNLDVADARAHHREMFAQR